MQEGGQKNARVQAIYSRDTRRPAWIPQLPWDQTTHSKIAMPMTAASVAQRRMGFKARRAQKYEGQSPYLVSQGFSRGGSDEYKMRGAILLWIQQGGGIWPL